VITDQAALGKLLRLQCPECGGVLLRGPRGGASRNLTCRSCKMKFNALGFEIGQALGAERLGLDPAQAAYYDPAMPPRACDHCGTKYTGRAVYCSMACALDDA
jgi:hypothetical protein